MWRPGALDSLGVSLDAVRLQVEEIIGRGQQAPTGHIPFTQRAKKALELSLVESQQLGENYIGPEHVLLGLLREGDGVATQVLVQLGADLNRVRQEVIHLLHVHQAREAMSARPTTGEHTLLPGVQTRLDAVEDRLAAVEQQVGIRLDTSDLDEQIAQFRRDKEAAIDVKDFERAAVLRDQEKELLARKTALEKQWAAGRPARPVLAERCQQLAEEIERLRALLRQHGIDPQDKPA